MKKTFTLIFLFACSFSFAQNPDIKRTWHWYFGNGAGIDFSSGTAVADTSGALHTYEGCGVMSDTSGNLLFYTDGDTVWNKLHQPMPNGTGLFGCGNYGSSSQLVLIQKPVSNNLYYIFTTDCAENFPSSRLTYHIVDMLLDNGKGAVIAKNILLSNNTTEGLAITRHCNGIDYWLVAHEYNTTNFLTYEVTTNGIAPSPVISSQGQLIFDPVLYINFNLDGSLLTTGFENLIDEVFSFDNTNGMLCLKYNLYNPLGAGFDNFFSPDSKKLYTLNGGSQVYQYDLSAGNDSATISSTVTMVAYNSGNSTFGTFQRAIDGKIYISSIYEDSISIINNPNSAGLACNVSVLSFYLGGRKSALGLPNLNQNYFSDSLFCTTCSTGFMNQDIITGTVLFYPNPADDKLIIDLQQYSVYTFPIKLEVTNILGQQVTGQVIFANQIKNHKFILNTQNFNDGIFFISLQSKNLIITKKIIINH